MLHLQIVTPEKTVFDDEVDQVSIPTSLGQITVLPHHVGLITEVEPGELIIKKHNKEDFFASGFGFAQIGTDNVRILVDLATASDEIEERKIEDAKKQAEEALKQRRMLSEEEYATAAANLQKALAQLKIKRRRHQRI